MKKAFIILRNLYTLWAYRSILMRCGQEFLKHSVNEQGILSELEQSVDDEVAEEVYDGIMVANRLHIILSMKPAEMRSDFKKISRVIREYDKKQ